MSPRSGFVTFAGSEGRGILLPLESSTTAEARARRFVDLYGKSFGLTSSAQLQLMRAPHADAMGLEHVRWQQVHQGVPVRGGEFLVHLKGSRVVAANGRVTADFPASMKPTVSAETARASAKGVIEKHRANRARAAEYSDARLEIFNRMLIGNAGEDRSRLAWFVEAKGTLLREYIWIDAQSGIVLLHFSQLHEAKSRQIYDANHAGVLPGLIVRSEGGPATGDADADIAYTYTGSAYEYFLNNHGRDSFDNTGATIISSVHYCDPDFSCPTYQNAVWTGTQIAFSDGFASADDIVVHELAHAVTEYTANLFYYMQSGALNESFSDIFGETADLTNGLGNDASNVRWLIGEDLAIGAGRNMSDPTEFFDPAKMSDTNFWCSLSDQGGVHTNSGVPNHAYALMVDGGTYNDTTVTGIGLTKAAKIQYRALTIYLISGSGFSDNFNALQQSCTDLVGTSGITSGDCTQVVNALLAVEMNNTWSCFGAQKAPPLCAAGVPANTFVDTFESVTGNWTATNGDGVWSAFITDFAKDGTRSAYGTDPGTISDHRLTQTSSVLIPSGARMYFDHAFEFETDGFNAYDGGVLEYSTNGGSSWNDAAPLFDAGQLYNSVIESGFDNPLAGEPAFGHWSYGYTGTRLNLASLAGQNVRFRFRIASDEIFGATGWFIDNVRIYTCSTAATGSFPVVDEISNLGSVNVSAESSAVIGYAGLELTDVAITSTGAMWAISFDSLYSINAGTGSVTLVGALGVGGMNALVGYGTTLLGASNATTSLYTINTTTGAATALSGSLGFPSTGDLAFHGGTLYAAVTNNTFSDLVRISLNLSGNSFTATNLGHVSNENTLYALAEGADHNLYGLSGTKVLRIDTSNPGASVVVVPNYAANLSGLADANGATSNVVAFTDHPLTTIRAVHITELRNRIAAIRSARGLSIYSFTDPSLVTQTTPVKAIHITDLRTALTQVYTALGSTSPTFTDGSLSGVAVKALHITELRAAVMAIE